MVSGEQPVFTGNVNDATVGATTQMECVSLSPPQAAFVTSKDT
jgi:hypothetical protein